jgi:DNA-binding GntR family transcriptional regulator
MQGVTAEGPPMRLSDKAYQLIRQKIITLELSPRSAIDEQALIEELQVGRTPIREALQRLAAEDLVSIIPRRGMFVAEISLTDLQKIFELRVLLEGFCARLAAQRATEEQLDQLEAIVQELETVLSENGRALMSIDERFHEMLYEAADNEFLADTLRRLHALSFRIWYLVLERLGSLRSAMEQHIEIAQALRARDGVQAEALLQQHISEFQRKIKSVL